jgi:hypothetical protein
VLFLGVDHEDGVWKPAHPADTAQVMLELLQLTGHTQRFLLRHGVEVTGGAHPLQLLHLGHPGAYRGEVGEHPAKTSFVHIGHAALGGIAGHGALGLLLGSHEQDAAAVRNQVPDERVGHLDASERLV